MLAGLYYRFSLSGPTGIKLVTDPGTERRLENLIDVITDADSEYFSLGTRPADARRFEFDVKMEWEGWSATACILECRDYPGGWVEGKHRRAVSDGEEPASSDFEDALKDADILMAVLDGEKVGRLTAGKPDWDTVRSLENLMKIIDRSGQRDIYLIITKWDVLPGAGDVGYPLRQVLNTLETNSDQFRRFRQSERLASMRIIPVAALGLNGFARANPVGEGMIKSSGEPWEPFNVELPFFCALPEILTHDVERPHGKMAAISARVFDVLKTVEFNLPLLVAEVKIPAGELMAKLWHHWRRAPQGRSRQARPDYRGPGPSAHRSPGPDCSTRSPASLQ